MHIIEKENRNKTISYLEKRSGGGYIWNRDIEFALIFNSERDAAKFIIEKEKTDESFSSEGYLNIKAIN